jgi:hypothetical protein
MMPLRRKSLPLFVGLFALCAAAPLASGADPALKSGTASGSFTAAGKTVKIGFAATFSDPRDGKKPLVLVLSDKEVPASSWKSSSDLSAWRREHPFMGVSFWIDEKNDVFRTDFYDGTSFPTSASGIFDLKLTRAAGSVSGTAKSTPAAAKLHDSVVLDATFNAPAK